MIVGAVPTHDQRYICHVISCEPESTLERHPHCPFMLSGIFGLGALCNLRAFNGAAPPTSKHHQGQHRNEHQYRYQHVSAYPQCPCLCRWTGRFQACTLRGPYSHGTCDFRSGSHCRSQDLGVAVDLSRVSWQTHCMSTSRASSRPISKQPRLPLVGRRRCECDCSGDDASPSSCANLSEPCKRYCRLCRHNESNWACDCLCPGCRPFGALPSHSAS